MYGNGRFQRKHQLEGNEGPCRGVYLGVLGAQFHDLADFEFPVSILECE